MNGKRKMYTEVAYLLGLVILALGTALMERADFGMSMVVAPAYLLHLKVSQMVPWFSFGVAEYCLQAALLVLTCVLLRRVKLMYLFSFGTAFLYGNILDWVMRAIGLIPSFGIAGRVVFYLAGMLLCSIGVSLLFHTYIAPEAYELLVKEVSSKYRTDIHKTKTVYDCTSCAVAVIMSFAFFGIGHFEGVKLGTVLCALINGWLIGQCSREIETRFTFADGLGLAAWFR